MKALNTQTLKVGLKAGLKFVNKNLPTVMTFAGAVGFCATMYEVSRSSITAKEILEQAEADKAENDEELTKKERALIIAKTCWKAFLLGLITLGFFFGANHVSLKRQAALGAAYAMTLQDFDEYKAKAKEMFGETKTEKIKDEIAADKILALPDDYTSSVPGTGPLWIDSWTNTPFRADLETIRRTIIDLNEDLYRKFDNEITMNDILTALSAECHAPQLGSVANGDMFGFSPDLTGSIDADIRYGKTRNGEPCGYLNFNPELLRQNLHDSYMTRGY